MPQKSSVYDKIQNVYSIWICPDRRTKQNAITDYTMHEIVRTGNNTCEKTDYDKLQVIVVTLGQDGISSTDRLIKYLSLLLSDEKPVEERKQQLEEEYRIKTIKSPMQKRLLQRASPGMIAVNHRAITLSSSATPDMKILKILIQ